MEFKCETTYNWETMAVMAKAMRKTVRRKRSRRSHIFGWIVLALGLLLSIVNFLDGDPVGFSAVITWAAMAMILVALLFEDRINGWVAWKRLLPGTEGATAIYRPDGFDTATDVGKSQWKYDKIQLVAETAGYFVFIFSPSHAQLYDKAHLCGGTPDEFREFIEKATGKPVQHVE
mgnify:FL=1